MRTTPFFAGLLGLMLLFSGCKKDSTASSQCTDDGLAQTVPDPDLFILQPNGISPNGDGLNDAFAIVGFSKANPQIQRTFTTRRLKVMRSGTTQAVYDNANYQNNFDGHDATGQELPEGNYRYELTLDNNLLQGSIKIVRTSKACSCRVVDISDPYFLPNCP